MYGWMPADYAKNRARGTKLGILIIGLSMLLNM
jgi:hypothetical protein